MRYILTSMRSSMPYRPNDHRYPRSANRWKYLFKALAVSEQRESFLARLTFCLGPIHCGGNIWSWTNPSTMTSEKPKRNNSLQVVTVAIKAVKYQIAVTNTLTYKLTLRSGIATCNWLDNRTTQAHNPPSYLAYKRS